MDLSSKKVLFINLENESSEVKTFPDYMKYLGGYALALKIYQQYKEYNPTIFAIGPLNGAFPYASKTAVLFKQDSSLQEIYLGGHLSTRLKFTGLDAVVIYGCLKEHKALCVVDENVNFKEVTNDISDFTLPGKSTTLSITNNKFLIDGYFGESDSHLAKRLQKTKLLGICITGTKTFTPADMVKYEEIYKNLIKRTDEVSVEKAFFPSCSGCPMGCEYAKEGESKGDPLLQSLVACKYAEKIYGNIGTVFSCLNTLGYDYTHEDIEAIPHLVKVILQELKI